MMLKKINKLPLMYKEILLPLITRIKSKNNLNKSVQSVVEFRLIRNNIKLVFYKILGVLTLILFHSGFYGTPAKAQGEKTVIDEIIATVNDEIILKSELELGYLQTLNSGEKDKGNLRCMVLESLLGNKILIAKSKIDSVQIEKKKVDQELNRKMDYFVNLAGSEKALEKYYNKTIFQLKEDLRSDVKEQMLTQEMRQTILKDIKITPTEVRKYYNKIPSDSLPYFDTEVELAQIVLIPKILKAEKAKLKEDLNRIRNEILNGGEFTAAAKKYSQDGATAPSGGELGYFNKGELAPEFEAAALKLKTGEISEIIETKFGFHIIQLIDRKGDRFNSRHILLRPDATNLDLDGAKIFLDSIRAIIQKDSMNFTNAARKFSEDKNTADNGGMFIDPVSGDTRIPVDKLPPPVFFAIDTMIPGAISTPKQFKTEDGKIAFRIIWYKSKYPPHQANIKDDYQKIYTGALNDKKSEKLSKWFSESLKEVYIKLDDQYQSCDFWKRWKIDN